VHVRTTLLKSTPTSAARPMTSERPRAMLRCQMISRRKAPRLNLRPDYQVTRATAAIRRFTRADGRFDLPVVAGRTPQQVARRLA
jgi:hypothetical protein